MGGETSEASARRRRRHDQARRRNRQGDHDRNAKRKTENVKRSTFYVLRSTLLRSVIRGFLRDGDVVDVALAEAGGGDANQLCLLLEPADAAAAAISHPGPQAADKLVHHGGDATLV